MTHEDWGLTEEADARTYLAEVGRLWITWVVGLGALALTDGWLLLASGFVVIAALLWMARPLQRRAADLVQDDRVTEGEKSLVVARKTERDLALRALAYGEAPLRRAVDLAATGSWWLTARVVVIGLTIAAFGFVLIDLFVGSSST
jgi:hypothetical protein